MESKPSPPLNFQELFGNPNPVEIEIGCGKGMFLVARAEQNPKINFLGVDRAGKWMKGGVRKVTNRKLANIKFLKGIADNIFEGALEKESISIFHIYFPDPWPKRRHQRRRLITPQFLQLLHGKLKQEGLVEIATDDFDYYRAIKKAVDQTLSLWLSTKESLNERLFAPEIKTNYEGKYQLEGRAIYYLELKK